jgi:hypothetical protein
MDSMIYEGFTGGRLSGCVVLKLTKVRDEDERMGRVVVVEGDLWSGREATRVDSVGSKKGIKG